MLIETLFIVTLSALVGGIAFRIRGGMLMQGRPHWFSRGIWSVVAGLCVTLATWNPWVLLTIPAFFAGTPVGWFKTLGLEKPVLYPLMALRGILFTAFAGIVLWFFGYGWWFILAGAACPILYWISYQIPSTKHNFQTGPEIGEFLFGAYVCSIVWFL